MFQRYVFIHYIKSLFLVFAGTFGLIYAYLLGDYLILFKEKDWNVLISYIIYSLPIFYFYLSAFILGFSAVFTLRRFVNKNIDMITLSFGVSPIGFSKSMLLFSILVLFFNLIISYRLYPESQAKLFRIEREYKKAKELEKGIVRNVWLREEADRELRFYNFQVVDVVKGNIYNFQLIRIREGSIVEIINGEKGLWKDSRIELPYARVINLLTGEDTRRFIILDYIDIKNVKPLAQSPEHLPADSLIMLSLLGERTGINSRHFIYELLKRVLTSLLPFLLLVCVCWSYLRWRKAKPALAVLTIVFSAHWLLMNILRSAAENTEASMLLLSFLYTPLPAFMLKALYDLAKGFRV